MKKAKLFSPKSVAKAKQVPQFYASVFPQLNDMQSKCFSILMDSNKNLCVGAPTGSGKTVLLELALVRLIMSGDQNAVYIAPTKALCSERAKDWAKFMNLNIKVVEFTGDSEISIRVAKDARVLITTPEKLDSMTRQWRDSNFKIGLVLVDEVHLIGEDRGVTLEVILTRIKAISLELKKDIRIVAVSATIPNLSELAEWLNADYLEFDDSYRPCKLEKLVLGFPNTKSYWIFEKTLTKHLKRVIEEHADGMQVLVFCSTRKSTQLSALELKCAQIQNVDAENQQLQECLNHQVGFHHAGLSASDRTLVESLFCSGKIQIVCTTSTLALGVNMPADCVIIKGTKLYNGDTVDYKDLQIVQMMGRAGRKSNGKAIILTSNDCVSYYKALFKGKTVQSQLHLNIVDHLNSEISQNSISSLQDAHRWLTNTFYYVQEGRKPKSELLSFLEDNVCKLIEHNLITKSFKPTALGLAMSRYCIHYDTMINLISAQPSFLKQLYAIADSKEFSTQDSVSDLNHAIKYPLASVKTSQDKVYVSLQGYLQSQKFIANIRDVFRIIKCLQEIQLHFHCGLGLLSSVFLHQSFKAHAWFNSKLDLKQIHNIGPALCAAFASKNVETIPQLLAIEPWKIEQISNRNPPFGTTILESAKKIPIISASICVKSSICSIDVNQHPSFCVVLSFDSIFQLLSYNRIPLKPCSVSFGSTPAFLAILLEDFIGLDLYFKFESNQCFSVPNLPLPESVFLPPEKKIASPVVKAEIQSLDHEVLLSLEQIKGARRQCTYLITKAQGVVLSKFNIDFAT